MDKTQKVIILAELFETEKDSYDYNVTPRLDFGAFPSFDSAYKFLTEEKGLKVTNFETEDTIDFEDCEGKERIFKFCEVKVNI